jgi:hypothetical protein
MRFDIEAIARMLNFLRNSYRLRPCFLTFILVTFTGTLLAAPQRGRGTPVPAVAAPPAPFHAGETLNLSGGFLGMTGVIIAKLSVIDDHAFYGRPAWHLQGRVQTLNPLKYVYAVDDQFDSYSSQPDVTGMQFELYLHESGKNETHVLRLANVPGAPTNGVVQVPLPANTRDPLDFLYYIRTINWQQTPELHTQVFDGSKIYNVIVNVTTPSAETRVQAGTFTATGLGIRAFEGNTEVTNMKITIWIANDAAHTPVLIDVALPFGSGRVELTK